MIIPKENTLENLRNNFTELITSDPKILSLYLAASQHDDEHNCPTYWGNLHVFLDIMSDEWLSEEWDAFEKSNMNFTIDEKADLVKCHVVEYLKGCINESELVEA